MSSTRSVLLVAVLFALLSVVVVMGATSPANRLEEVVRKIVKSELRQNRRITRDLKFAKRRLNKLVNPQADRLGLMPPVTLSDSEIVYGTYKWQRNCYEMPDGRCLSPADYGADLRQQSLQQAGISTMSDSEIFGLLLKGAARFVGREVASQAIGSGVQRALQADTEILTPGEYQWQLRCYKIKDGRCLSPSDYIEWWKSEVAREYPGARTQADWPLLRSAERSIPIRELSDLPMRAKVGLRNLGGEVRSNVIGAVTQNAVTSVMQRFGFGGPGPQADSEILTPGEYQWQLRCYKIKDGRCLSPSDYIAWWKEEVAREYPGARTQADSAWGNTPEYKTCYNGCVSIFGGSSNPYVVNSLKDCKAECMAKYYWK